jgi:hypothetical protein
MTSAAPTRHVRRGRPERALRRLDNRGRHRRGDWHDDRDREPDFKQCLALLDEAIARAERWYADREREIAELDHRAADVVRRLREAGAVRPSITWTAATAA